MKVYLRIAVLSIILLLILLLWQLFRASEIPQITEFTFRDTGQSALINQRKGTISAALPYGVDLRSVYADISYTGLEVFPLQSQAQNFLQPLSYTVIAASGLRRTYSTNFHIKTFTLPPQLGAVLIDFQNFRGTLDSIPSGLFLQGENGEGEMFNSRMLDSPNDFFPLTGIQDIENPADSTFEGFGAFTNTYTGYSLGIRERGETDLRNSRIFYEYTNRTGLSIVAFLVAYDVEVWYWGERDNRIRLRYSDDDFSQDIVSTANPRGGTTASNIGKLLDGYLPENRSRVELTFEVDPVQPGDSAVFRWQYSNHEIDSGEARSALALNNIVIIPVFE